MSYTSHIELTAARRTKYTRSAFAISVISDRLEALSYVDALPDDVITTGYQSKAFLKAWLSHDAAKPFFLIFETGAGNDVLLPLETKANNIAIYCGDNHANGNFPVGKREDLEALSAITKTDISKLLKDMDNAPDALFLERQHSHWEDIKNPFVFENSVISPNVALSLLLEGGFSQVLRRHHAKRKRKNQRNFTRKLEALGPVRYVDQVPRNDVAQVLDIFFEMKAARLKKQGLRDTFADQKVRHMFVTLFKESCATARTQNVLQAIYCGDEPASIIGCTVYKGRITVEFGVFAEKYTECGAGELLFFHSIENACAQGLDIYDFGVGDEFYKRRWCEIETWHRDTYISVSLRGQFKTCLGIIRSHLVRTLKTNKTLWNTFKNARKKLIFLKKP